MTPALRILLGVVIVLAILHALLRVRTRASRRDPPLRAGTASGARGAPMNRPLPSDPAEALAQLRQAAQRGSRNDP